jgi:hypothetical protein
LRGEPGKAAKIREANGKHNFLGEPWGQRKRAKSATEEFQARHQVSRGEKERRLPTQQRGDI